MNLFAAQGGGDMEALLSDYSEALRLTGDRGRGKRLFAENCSPCHRLEGRGFDVGPSLLGLSQSGADKILASILDPNREINPEFVNFIITKKNGETFSGIIKSESPTGIDLALGAGEHELIQRSDIEELRPSGISMMPEQLEVDLDVKAMSDLLAYIEGVN